MARVAETIGAVWALARLAAQTRFRFRGRYWQWRMETAFGSDRAKWPPLRARFHAMLEYGRWVHRMSRRG